MEAIRAAKAELLNTHDIIVADSPGEEGDASRTVTFLASSPSALQPPSSMARYKDARKAIRLARNDRLRVPRQCSSKQDAKTQHSGATPTRTIAYPGNSDGTAEVRRYDAIVASCDTAVTRMQELDAKEAAADIERLFAEIIVPRLVAAGISSHPVSIGSAIHQRVANE
jgi:hypothetical protein